MGEGFSETQGCGYKNSSLGAVERAVVDDVVKGVPVPTADTIRVEVGCVLAETDSVFGMEGVSDCQSEGSARCVSLGMASSMAVRQRG